MHGIRSYRYQKSPYTSFAQPEIHSARARYNIILRISLAFRRATCSFCTVLRSKMKCKIKLENGFQMNGISTHIRARAKGMVTGWTSIVKKRTEWLASQLLKDTWMYTHVPSIEGTGDEVYVNSKATGDGIVLWTTEPKLDEIENCGVLGTDREREWECDFNVFH